MKKYLQKAFKIVMLFIILFTSGIVYAESAPATLKMTNYTLQSTPTYFPTTFHVKKTTNGKYAYCAHYAKASPITSVTYSKGHVITDNGMNYILNEAMNAGNDNSFFVYQTALWSYMVETGLMPTPYYDITVFNTKLKTDNTAAGNRIKTLINNAKNAGKHDTSTPTIKIDTSNVKFVHNASDDMYVLSPITITSSTGAYTVTINEAPAGTTVRANGDQIQFLVPGKNLTSLSSKLTFTINNSKTVNTSYYYEPNNNTYQKMALTFKETKKGSSTKTITLMKNKSITIDKVDENGKSLSGSTLKVLDSNGVVIATWTTNGQKQTISKLKQGTYTISEVSAPTGYILNTQKITFEVKADGTIVDSNNNEISSIEIKNTKTSVQISKKDLTTKEELSGAILAIKNESGQEVISWTTTNKPHVIKGLAVGNYTLIEKNAPAGYSLNTQIAEFRIDAYGKLYDKNGKTISGIVMYNKKIETTNKETKPTTQETTENKNIQEHNHQTIISKQDETTKENLEGSSLIVKDESGNIIDQWTTTKDNHIIEGLKPGNYTITETNAPAGYILNNKTYTFTVNNDIDTTRVVMYNKKSAKKEEKVTPTSTTNEPKQISNNETSQEIEVDNTASFQTIVSTTLGVIMIVVGSAILIINSKNKKHNKI